jgi:hypothetical protein
MTLRRRIKTVQSFLKQRRDALRFDGIPEPRRRRGRRWSAATLLSTAVLSLMLLARSLRQAERLSRDLADARRIKGLRRRLPDSTLGDFVARLAPAPLRRHLHAQVLAEHRRKALEPTVLPIRAIAVDGKNVATLRARVNRDCQRQDTPGQPTSWLYRVVNATLISAAAAVCIDQRPIPAATNDMGIFRAFYADLRRAYGRAGLFDLVSTDAGFTSEANARLLDEDGCGYWMALKGNQPELLAEARRVLIPQSYRERPEAQTDWELDSSRGWIRRELWRTGPVAPWSHWTHLRQVVLVRVWKAAGCQSGKHPVYGPPQILEERLHVTNLVRGRLNGEQLLALDRAHWRIENNLHGTLDIQWEEDHGRWVRRGRGLPVTALLRVLAYNLLELLRAVHLRSAEARAAAWQQLRDWMYLALMLPDERESAEEAARASA